MKKNTFETLVGFTVLACAALFLILTLKTADIQTFQNYNLIAEFENIEGVSSGSEVKIGGVKIGHVSDHKIDPITYQAILTLKINQDIQIPKDSSIKIASSGLIGSKYLKLEPGGDEEYLSKNEKILFTQSTIDLEDLISRFIFKKDK